MKRRHVTRALLLILLGGLGLWSARSVAELYTYLDAHGTRVYTDQRPTGGVSYRRVGIAATGDSANRSGGQLFVYQLPSGERLVTNQRQREDAATLIATYGRPTASVRCRLSADEVMPVGAGPFDGIIVREAHSRNLDPLLVKSVIWVESCFDQYAVSRVGAHGLMQLMPATAAELGVTDRFDPAQNIRGGVTYLAWMLERFDQNLDLALAAYNAGPGAVERHSGVPPFAETRNYIERIHAHYQLHAAASGHDGTRAAAN
ncbi:MAG: lytic transglycosylase domain-containing protein [Thioalkalivibrio sp.]|nr:lytic transglycosylase domain-containing protein [Thioalkalivibrio sp.]